MPKTITMLATASSSPFIGMISPQPTVIMVAEAQYKLFRYLTIGFETSCKPASLIQLFKSGF